MITMLSSIHGNFEIIAIPIKNWTGRSTIISGVNYSTSINNQLYFKADNI